MVRVLKVCGDGLVRGLVLKDEEGNFVHVPTSQTVYDLC